MNNEMKLKLNACYGSNIIAPTLTDEEIIQKVRKQIRLLYRYIMECEVRSEMYQYGRVEGMLYGYFSADRLNMKAFEQFSYTVECMDNEFYGRYGYANI